VSLPFSSETRTWFESAFAGPTEVQRRGWEAIALGHHALLVAPTGSGKTLAAFLWSIDRLLRAPRAERPGTRVLYVSPLKALVHDVERNLRAPLAGICAKAGADATARVRVAVRTGDTSQRERRLQARAPGEILVTTPESLYLLLGSRARETLATVDTVIVDEVHALAPAKRGAHLALSLERLAALTGHDPQRIGLSATVNPMPLVAGWLGGDREVRLVDASQAPRLRLEVVVPVPDMERVEPPVPPARAALGGPILAEPRREQAPEASAERGIWAALYPRLLEDIRASRSTIVFVNSRGLCERLTQRINDLAGEELALAHHGSVSHERRTQIEEGLKSGGLKAIVATSSLELGIDMGAVDRVLLVESPGSVARGLQRVGRAGHGVGEVSSGTIYPKYRGDLLECAAVARRMLRGEIEQLRVPRNPLDVLAQQVVAMCCDAPRTRAEIVRIVRRAWSYRELTDEALDAVLEMLAGRYADGDLADLRPRLAWDRADNVLSARRGAALVTRLNAGTIPDRGTYAVHLGPDGPRLGELDEEMVFETRAGETVRLGASTWRVEEITTDRVVVSPAPGEPGRLPFWRGDGPGRPLELGHAVGALARELGALEPPAAMRRLAEEGLLDAHAASNLVAYLHQQRAATGVVPSDRAIVVERFRDELGDWRVCILTPFGARVHAPWAMAIQHRLGAQRGYEVQLMYTDDGIVVRFAEAEELPGLEALLPDADEVREVVTTCLADTALFAGLFRENAVRALVLARRRPGQRTPLWAQRLKASDLLGAVRRYREFPVVVETYRQALGDVFDIPALEALLRGLASRSIRIHEVETPRASPFARSLVFAYVAAFIYEQDAPLAERRAQALTLDRELLADLLGQSELRDLIDPQVLAETRAYLRAQGADRAARDADELHDHLRRLGDLSGPEIAERCAGDSPTWLAQLERQKRAARVCIAGGPRWIAADDAGLYRDALAVVPPSGLPAACLASVEHALERLVRRYARTNGPFVTGDLAGRCGLPAGALEPLLESLAARGLLVRGEISPLGSEPEWCDADVLRVLKRRTLARLRNELAPVDAGLLAGFLADWHGLGARDTGPTRLEEVVGQLEGLALPWSTLVEVILPARVPGFAREQLDRLCAAGRIVWVGRGSLGARDGRVALYRRERARVLLGATPEAPDEPLHRVVLAQLRGRGACFLTEIERAVGEALPRVTAHELESALMDLAWGGLVTNDTFAALRAPGRARQRRHATAGGGRWSAVEDLAAGSPPGDTERSLAQAQTLLARYGVLSREAALGEELPGGWGPLYRVLRAMEASGRVRRGYFVEGLSGAQFAWPGVVERLRAARAENGRDAAPRWLAALDPANPFGVLLRWPATSGAEGAGARRIPGAWLVLVGPDPVLWVGPGARSLVTFDTGAAREALPVALGALHELPRSGRRRLLVVEKVDGVAVLESELRPLLAESGFVADYRGMVADVRTIAPSRRASG
jgi:ATP-dependent Lhr-like helicase